MLFTYTLPKSQETNIIPESDEMVRLSAVAFCEEDRQKTRLFAIHGDTKFLIASLDPSKQSLYRIDLSFFSSQEVRLLSENAPLNVFGTINQFEEFEEFYEEELDMSDALTDENESESELETQMIEPTPPAGYKNPEQNIKKKVIQNGGLQAQMNARGKKDKKQAFEDKRKKKIAKKERKRLRKEAEKGAEASAPAAPQKAEVKKPLATKAKAEAENQTNVFLNSFVANSEVAEEGLPKVPRNSPREIPNVSLQLGKMSNFMGNKKRERPI